ncbi:MAG: hypothetical protein K2Q09_04440 [Phycisphaerales bacterium]|nr:hypothetical protein [Phycisphaerales bacterium]
MSSESTDQHTVLARGEIENACLLSAISDEGCSLSDLPARLGLSPLLKEPVSEAIAPLVSAGWVQESDGRVSLSQAGRAWLKERF